MISGEKILVTGATGMVGAPLAQYLAKENEVWGVARYTDPNARRAAEDAGIKPFALDLGAGDFTGLPDDFTYVLNLGFARRDIEELEDAIRINVEGPGLLMQHCRKAKATLIMSSMPIYTPNPDPMHKFKESDPIGASSYAYAPTSPYSKAGVEAVARFCARAFDMRVVICRLNSVVGPNICMPAQVARAVLSDQPVYAPHEKNMQTPIHIEDMMWQLEPLLNAASNPALIVNWCGDETMSVQDWVSKVNEWSGKNASVEVLSFDGAPIANAADHTFRESITGPCRKKFDVEFRKIYDNIIANEDLNNLDVHSIAVKGKRKF